MVVLSSLSCLSHAIRVNLHCCQGLNHLYHWINRKSTLTALLAWVQKPLLLLSTLSSAFLVSFEPWPWSSIVFGCGVASCCGSSLPHLCPRRPESPPMTTGALHVSLLLLQVGAASTVTSWSNQTPTALPTLPPPPLQVGSAPDQQVPSTPTPPSHNVLCCLCFPSTCQILLPALFLSNNPDCRKMAVLNKG